MNPGFRPAKTLQPMPDALQTALAVAHHWRLANGDPVPVGVVIVLDGQFVGSLATLPSPAEWAPGCLAVAADGQIHLARPAGFRGEVEWADLGVFALGDEVNASPPSPEPDPTSHDPADDDLGSPPTSGNSAVVGDDGIPTSLAGPEARPATARDAPDSP